MAIAERAEWTVEEATQRFARLPQRESPPEYNYEHFRTKHLAQDTQRTLTKHGVQPGELAPNFELPRADGGTLRLSDLRGRPILLHFGSVT